jgi:hypothetical protein
MDRSEYVTYTYSRRGIRVFYFIIFIIFYFFLIFFLAIHTQGGKNVFLILPFIANYHNIENVHQIVSEMKVIYFELCQWRR